MAGSLTEGTPGPSTRSGVSYVNRRTVEISTAIAVALLGAVVISESLTHDIGWNGNGPGSGYFPFRVGLLLVAVAIVRLLQIRLKPDSTRSFVTRDELQRSLSVLWPTMALVLAMIPLGCYVPSAVYLAWMMRRHGGHSWLLSAAYGAAVGVAFFLVFDLWFGVPLAKGPVEAALGLY